MPLTLIVPEDLPSENVSWFDAFAQPIEWSAWYWAEEIALYDALPGDGLVFSVFFAIRSGPVSPLTFERIS